MTKPTIAPALSVPELKELIMWAKSQRLKSVTLGAIAFEFSELAHIESLPDDAAFHPPTAPDLAKPPSSSKLPDGDARSNEDNDLLFWSTR
jgi:hypothetical protein